MRHDTVSVFWNNILIFFSTLQLFALLVVGMQQRPQRKAEGLWSKRWFLSLLFTINCTVRATMPRQDTDRVCFYDHFMSTVIVGRTLANIGELSFAALLCLALYRVNPTPFRSSCCRIGWAMNVVAQTCCWFSILTHDMRGHVVEESIWLLSGVALFVAVSSDFYSPGYRQLPADAKLFLKASLLAAPPYIAFMALVDVPMYYQRYYEIPSSKLTTAGEGLQEILRCLRVTKDDSLWMEEMPWMTGYFTAAVWVAIWLARAKF